MIKYEVKNGTAVLTLNRPEKRNALNPKLIAGLKKHLLIAADDESIKTLIITGEGSSFCSGADLEYLKELTTFSSVKNVKDSELIAELFLMVYSFPKPVIAAVNGPAIAGGFGLASVCDYIVADEQKAKFSYSEVKIGFIPAVVSVFLIKRIGEFKARQLLFSGETIDANEAFRLGIADKLSLNVMEESLAIAEKINRNSMNSVKLTKEITQKISNMSVKEAVQYCINLNAISRSTEDFRNGINKFLNKN